MGFLGVAIEEDATEQVVEFSANFPYYIHLLCEGAVLALLRRIDTGEKAEFRITRQEINDAIRYAIQNTQNTISRAYEDSVRNIRDSPRCKLTLYAIASWPQEPVPYNGICKWVGHVAKSPTGSVNISHQLQVLEKSGAIEKSGKGFYHFRNPLVKAFVILRARADTPENELAAIDAQITHVKKRLDRLRAGI